MSPLMIEVAIHYATCADEWPGLDSSPAQREAVAFFVKNSLLTERVSPANRKTYHATTRLRAYVQFLTGVPLPVSKWVLPTLSNQVGEDA